MLLQGKHFFFEFLNFLLYFRDFCQFCHFLSPKIIAELLRERLYSSSVLDNINFPVATLKEEFSVFA